MQLKAAILVADDVGSSGCDAGSGLDIPDKTTLLEGDGEAPGIPDKSVFQSLYSH
jgi:hypothetical protein